MADAFWDNVKRCADELKKAQSVDGVITTLNAHFPPSATEAFYGGSGGDNDFYEILDEAGWTILWADADYYFAAQAPDGSVLTYIEGDVTRGDQRA